MGYWNMDVQMMKESESLSANVTTLQLPDKIVYLIGTAHVSRKSVEEVRQTIESLKPDTVCVELCQTRFEALTQKSRWAKLNIFDVIRQGKTLLVLSNLALSAFQKKIGDQLGVEPGQELKTAIEAAESVGAKLVLADRDVQITLKRTWANIPWWKKLTVLGGVFEGLWAKVELDEEHLEELKNKDQLSELMAEFAERLPEVKKPLIDERDQYLMSSIERAPGECVVAVVGAGHVQGMMQHAGDDVDRGALELIPPKSRLVTWLKWIIPLIILAGFGWEIVHHESESLEQMLVAWVIPNSVMAALFSILALARPFSVLTALVASPITSLNPMLGAGLVVGLVEAWLRKPTVADLERLPEDSKTVRGFYRNPFTRVLLVAVFSTIGSALGGFLGLSWLIRIMAG